jgi:hypothetical protein
MEAKNEESPEKSGLKPNISTGPGGSARLHATLGCCTRSLMSGQRCGERISRKGCRSKSDNSTLPLPPSDRKAFFSIAERGHLQAIYEKKKETKLAKT